MKQRSTILLMACAALILSMPRAVRAQIDISANIQINSANDFYQPLQPYGEWVDVPSYGRCWHPRQVEAEWEPYTVGHWEWTDAGWYWVSDEPWGWACYHYGSWYDEPRVGWVWIPATDWAPAWVTWRTSDRDDYIGWAPCGPGRSVLDAQFFVFCDVHRFHDRFNRRDLIRNDTRIINRTRVIRDFQRQTIDFDGHQRTIYANRGPGVDPIRRATGAQFTARPVRDVIRESGRPDNRRDGGQRRDQSPADNRRDTPASTGRDQRNDQQNNIQQQRDLQRRDQSPVDNSRQTPAPTGRDQQRNYQQNKVQQQRDIQRQDQAPIRPRQEQQIQPDQRPQAPQRRQDAMPPTGQDQPRTYRETPRPTPAPQQRQEIPTPAPEQRREVPVPQQRPVTPPERTLPPTGREQGPAIQRREAAPQVQAPAVRQGPAAPDGGPGRAGGDGRDRNP